MASNGEDKHDTMNWGYDESKLIFVMLYNQTWYF